MRPNHFQLPLTIWALTVLLLWAFPVIPGLPAGLYLMVTDFLMWAVQR